MQEFDEVIERRGTGATKWEKYRGRDVLPFWVADMDFRAPAFVLDAVAARLHHGVLGYTETPLDLTLAAIDWLKREYRWNVEPDWLVWLPGVVPGLNLACRSVGEPTTSVLMPVPVYYPFLAAPDQAERARIDVPLVREGERWVMPFDRLEHSVRPDTRLLMFCNPQNPTGRVYGDAELAALADFCVRHDLVVCSDEIHCPLVLDENLEHRPIATLSADIADRSITLMAPTKAYNIPGLACAFAVIPNTTLRLAFLRARGGLLQSPGPLAFAAALAAYRDRSDWLGSLRRYLRANADLVLDAVNRLPGVRTTPIEATCLAWIDVKSLGLRDAGAFFEQHGLGLSDGAQFAGPGFVRFNFGCPRRTLEEGLRRFEAAVRSLRT
jgi:cysteine-S-conjugate beta-lyase